jgi:ankyrin repeat protein
MIEEYNFDIWNGYPENSILFAAAGVENSDFIKYIYKNMSNNKRFNINSSDSLGLIPIHVASYTSLSNLKLIEHKGGNINSQDNDGYNCLHYAAWYGMTEIVKYLIEEKSMDANLLTLDEMNPMLLAVESGDIETVKVIMPLYDGTYYKTVLKTAKKLDDKSIYLYLKPLLKY